MVRLVKIRSILYFWYGLHVCTHCAQYYCNNHAFLHLDLFRVWTPRRSDIYPLPSQFSATMFLYMLTFMVCLLLSSRNSTPSQPSLLNDYRHNLLSCGFNSIAFHWWQIKCNLTINLSLCWTLRYWHRYIAQYRHKFDIWCSRQRLGQFCLCLWFLLTSWQVCKWFPAVLASCEILWRCMRFEVHHFNGAKFGCCWYTS